MVVAVMTEMVVFVLFGGSTGDVVVVAVLAVWEYLWWSGVCGGVGRW